jgi:PAS domain S-box-containing protein
MAEASHVVQVSGLPRGAGEGVLAEVLRERAGAVLEAWRRAVLRAAGAAGVGAPAAPQPYLLHYVPELLARLSALTSEHAAGNAAAGGLAAALSDALADEEVLAAVQREYGHLRRVLSAALTQAPPVTAVQLERVHEALDAEMEAAVRLHVEACRRRDAQLRALLTAPLGVEGLAGLLRLLADASPAVDCAAVYLLEADGTLVPHAALEGAPRTWRPGQGLVGRVAARAAEECLQAPPQDEADVPAGTRVVCAAPVLLEAHRVVGVVQLGSRTAGALPAIALRLLEVLARRVGTHVATERLRELEAFRAREGALEQELRESEERFRFVFEDAAIGIAVADMRGRFLRANAALQRLTGYSEAELRERTIPDVTPPDDMARELKLFRDLEAGRREPYRIERRVLRKDGSAAWCVLTVSLGRSARGPFIIGMVEDLTPLRRAEELERTAVFRERFLGMLGHDLRSPLNAISLSAHRLLKLGLGGDAESSARRIGTTTARMGRMVGDLLDLARSRMGGGMPVVRTRVDLGEAARAAVEEASSAHPGRALRCTVPGPVWGELDADRIAQVLQNLLSNALEYGPEDEPVGLTLREEAGWAELAVHNGGTPIPPERQADIFEPFRRAAPDAPAEGPGALRRASGNLGLGLFIVAQVVQAHGGSVRVRSAAGEGTTFTVRLPLAPQPEHAGGGGKDGGREG